MSRLQERQAADAIHWRYARQGWRREEFDAVNRVPRRMILSRGDVAAGPPECESGVFTLITGVAKLVALSSNGKQLALAYLRQPGDSFAVGSVEQSRFDHEYIEALADATMIYGVPWHELFALAAGYVQIALTLARLEQEIRVRRETALVERCLYPVKARLAHALYELGAGDPDMTVHETREAIAEMISTSEDRVTKALHELRWEGLVNFEDHGHRHIELVDLARLRGYGRD